MNTSNCKSPVPSYCDRRDYEYIHELSRTEDVFKCTGCERVFWHDELGMHQKHIVNCTVLQKEVNLKRAMELYGVDKVLENKEKYVKRLIRQSSDTTGLLGKFIRKFTPNER